MRSSRKIKYIPKHIFFTRKKTEIRKRVVVLQIFPCAINTLNTTVTRFFAAWAILKRATYPASPETPVSFNDLFPHNRSSSLQKIEDKQI